MIRTLVGQNSRWSERYMAFLPFFELHSRVTLYSLSEFGQEVAMQLSDDALTNHEVTICLQGGAVLGPFNATWSKESSGDVRALSREFDDFLKGESQSRFKFHLHDTYTNTVHTVILRFENVTAIYDHVKLRCEG